MIAFEVGDMTCGHCVSTIREALKTVDKNAKVDVDLGAHRVQVETAAADATALANAIRQAGYSPRAVPEGGPRPVRQRASCCCR
jgi:copper chaperone